MDIKTKAIEKIAAQLASLVGVDNFRIVHEETLYGAHTDLVERAKKRKSAPKVHDFKNGTDFYKRIQDLAPGQSIVLHAPGIPSHSVQAAVAGIAVKFHGAGSCMTARRPDDGVDLLRLT